MKTKNRIILTSATLILVLSMTAYAAIIVDPPDTPRDFTSSGVYYSVNDVWFAVNQTMHFNQKIITSEFIMFNDTIFYITAPNRINVSLSFLSENFSCVSGKTKVIEFWAETSSGNVWFNCTGIPQANYVIFKDDVRYDITYSNNIVENCSFNNSVWGTEYRFEYRKTNRYDVNVDTFVDVFDLNDDWSQRAGQQPYNGLYDVNGDLVVDVFDLNNIWSNRD